MFGTNKISVHEKETIIMSHMEYSVNICTLHHDIVLGNTMVTGYDTYKLYTKENG